MPTAKVITRFGSVKDLLEVLQQESELASQIFEYFDSYCDCDVTIWLTEEINNGNQEVIDKIRELIAPDDDNVLTRDIIHPEQNMLLSTFCIGQDLYGKYATGTGGNTELLIKEVSTVCGCQPYEVDSFNWSLFPQPTGWNDSSTFSSYYNNPDHDGVTLNVVLGGCVYAWDNSGANYSYEECVISFGMDTYPYMVDGGIVTKDSFNNNTGTRINLSGAGGAFTISNPTTVLKYDQLNFTYNMSDQPTHLKFPGVSTFNTWRSWFQTSPHPPMGPTVFEMWYSLNPDRSNPSNGYCNYTFLGDCGSEAFPVINFQDPNDYVRQYCAGIFKTTAEMLYLKPGFNAETKQRVIPKNESDCLIAFIYDGNEVSGGQGSNGGILKIIVNGSVYQSVQVDFKVAKLNVNLDFITNKTFNEMGSNKSTVSSAEIFVSDLSGNSTRSILISNPIGIDTYQIKYAWGIESSSIKAVYGFKPPLFYTLPSFDIGCDPGDPMPPFKAARILAW